MLKIYIVDFLLQNRFLGATDTTAPTNVWAMTALIKKLQCNEESSRRNQGLGGKKELLNEDDTQKLTYFKAVIKDILRLHLRSLLFVPREINDDCIINGYKIPAKT